MKITQSRLKKIIKEEVEEFYADRNNPPKPQEFQDIDTGSAEAETFLTRLNMGRVKNASPQLRGAIVNFRSYLEKIRIYHATARPAVTALIHQLTVEQPRHPPAQRWKQCLTPGRPFGMRSSERKTAERLIMSKLKKLLTMPPEKPIPLAARAPTLWNR